MVRITDFNNSKHQSDQETEPRASGGALSGIGSLPANVPAVRAGQEDSPPPYPGTRSTASRAGRCSCVVSILLVSTLEGNGGRRLTEEETHPDSIIRSYLLLIPEGAGGMKRCLPPPASDISVHQNLVSLLLKPEVRKGSDKNIKG